MRCYLIDLDGYKHKLFEARSGNAELLRKLYVDDYNSKAQFTVATGIRTEPNSKDMYIGVSRRTS